MAIKNINSMKEIYIAAPVATRSGYGAHSREIVKALIKSGKYDVKIIPLRWGGTPQTALDKENPEDQLILNNIVSGQLNGKPDVFLHITIPNEFQAAGKVNIGITAGIETDRCKPEWVEGCNKMDFVIATSEHSKVAFENSVYDKVDKKTKQPQGRLSVTKPIKTLFEGVDFNIFNKNNVVTSELSANLNQDIKEDFCFLFVGHWLDGALGHDRKDVGMLIKVFLESFLKKAEKNKPALILKTSLAGFSIMERDRILSRIQDIRNIIYNSNPGAKLPNIYLLHGDLTDTQMNELYNHSKVKAMVSFTKGEGFGKPLLEFTTTGKPVIASGWSGQLDFLNPNYCFLLRGDVQKVHDTSVNDYIMKDSNWFTVNYDYAASVLRGVYDKYDEALEMSRKHRKYTMDNFSFDAMMNKLCDMIDNAEEISKESVGSSLSSLPKLSINKPEGKLTLPKLKRV